MYILRLDDAAGHMNIDNWEKMESLLDRYSIKPIVGIVPSIKDPELCLFEKDDMIWEKAKSWKEKGWAIAMHGYTHVYATNDGGLNPVNRRSEFAGLSLMEQKEKIKRGYLIFENHSLKPEIFFAPSHTFDMNTLNALREETPIRVISDTVANNIYYENGFYFIPQQSGKVRRLPFSVVTFCYHPNTMNNDDFELLELFFKKNKDKFTGYDCLEFRKRKRNTFDKLLNKIYFIRK